MTLDYFSKMYCINLNHRTDRWQESQLEFAKYSLHVKQFRAIPHVNGAIGCAMSHLMLYQSNRRERSIMVFEDDVKFTGDASHVDEALKRLPPDWMIVYLGGVIFPASIKVDRISDHVYRAENVVCTHAIGISRAGMEHMTSKYNYQKHGPIDEYYRSIIQPTGRAYCIVPMIATQRAGVSDITHKYGGDNNLLASTNQKFIV